MSIPAEGTSRYNNLKAIASSTPPRNNKQTSVAEQRSREMKLKRRAVCRGLFIGLTGF